MDERTREIIIDNVKMALSTAKENDILDSDERKACKKVIKRLKEGEDLREKDLEEIQYLGDMLAEQSFYEDTMGCFESILRVVPNREETLFSVAYFNHENGDMESAIEAFDKLLAVNPKHGDGYALCAENHYFLNDWSREHLGELYTEEFKREHLNKAVHDYLKAIELQEEVAKDNYFFLSKSYKELGEEEKAAHYMAEYEKLDKE